MKNELIKQKMAYSTIVILSLLSLKSHAGYGKSLGGQCFELTDSGARVGIVSQDKCESVTDDEIPQEKNFETKVLGAGMYCSMDASYAVAQKAKADGASSKDLKERNTVSLDPVIGVLYSTQVGESVYYSIVEGVDGDCEVKFVYKAL